MKYGLKKGFTLIELLVVIAIIGILASVIMVSINSARRKARNSKRSSDIVQLRSAFNLGINSGSIIDSYTVPTPIPDNKGWVCVSTTCYGGWQGYPHKDTVDAYLAAFLPIKPTDPDDTSRLYGGYIYNSNYGKTGSTGVVVPVGPTILWLLEVPATYSQCAPGVPFWTSSSYLECALSL
ncbi:MAG: prepilin-type N-terminal cleavage/methylation domain-containing protein [Candidatus Pacebacteria bacterium]|nr:prepilin-type N-terminal cleavage/methylation domain-containing protein [Candidatus Paceibacterota bacterium]